MKYRIGILILLYSLFFTFNTSFANYIDNLQSGWTLYGKTALIPKSSKSIKLKKSINNNLQSNLRKKILSGNKVVLLAKNNTILAEYYGIQESKTPGGNSISKSVVSLIIGKALCSGLIDINKKSEVYSKDLKNTSWGNATIEQLLKMSSGAYSSPSNLYGHRSINMQKELSSAIKGKSSKSVVKILKSVDEKKFDAGEKFNYSNADTLALGLVIKSVYGKEVHEIVKLIWEETGSNYDAFWLKNHLNETMSYMGLAANPKDWILLGNYVIKNLKKDNCFGKYLKKASNTQIRFNSFSDNRNYGYQMWTDCGLGSGAFCFVGALGQLLLIEPKTNMVLYVHSISRKWGGINHWDNYFFEAIKTIKN